MNAPRTFGELLAQWADLQEDIALVRAWRHLKVRTASGEFSPNYSPESDNVVLDLRGLSATGEPAPGQLPDQVNHVDQFLKTDGASLSWAPASAEFFTWMVRASAQTIANSVSYVKISWDTPRENAFGLWSASSPEALVLPSAGLWFFTARIRYAANATGTRWILLERNASEQLILLPAPALNGHATTIGLSGLFRLNVGDSITLETYQDSGGDLDVSPNGGIAASLTACKLGN